MAVTINGTTGITTPDIAVDSDAFGYTTGAGGTVTQATSKSTAVTLNKPTGQITMNNAALAANTRVSFTFNNSLIATADTIVINIGGAFSGYMVDARTNASGAAVVTLWNYSAGSLSEGIVLNFAIIKGATA
jgi:hypothetical protein